MTAHSSVLVVLCPHRHPHVHEEVLGHVGHRPVDVEELVAEEVLHRGPLHLRPGRGGVSWGGCGNAASFLGTLSLSAMEERNPFKMVENTNQSVKKIYKIIFPFIPVSNLPKPTLH